MGMMATQKKKEKKMILRLSKNYIYLSQVCRLVEDLRQLVAYNFFDSLHKVWNLPIWSIIDKR
jgi:hypothetical protein